MNVYLVIEDYGQDCGSGVVGIFATPTEAVAHVRKLNPKYTVNWPYAFSIEEWKVGATEPTWNEPGMEISGREFLKLHGYRDA